MEPAESDVGERNHERDRNGRFAVRRLGTGATISYWLHWSRARHLLAAGHAPLAAAAAAALTTGHASFHFARCRPGFKISVKFRRNFGIFFVFGSYREVEFR